MPLDFPSSPANGAVYGAYVYDSSITAWRSKGGATAATYVADTAPSGAVKGDMWYRSSDGTTYVYYVDADTSQWVEIRSEISASKVGLTPIVPTSITLSSGTGSVATSGLVTFTNTANVTLNNAFTSAYANYKTIIEINSASASLELRTYFASNGVINMTANYSQAGVQTASNTGTLSSHNGGNITYAAFGYLQPATNYGRSSASQDIFQPATTDFTRYVSASQAHTSGGAWTSFFDSGIFSSGVSFDGYTVAASTGTISGTVKVYGYN